MAMALGWREPWGKDCSRSPQLSSFSLVLTLPHPLLSPPGSSPSLQGAVNLLARINGLDQRMANTEQEGKLFGHLTSQACVALKMLKKE